MEIVLNSYGTSLSCENEAFIVRNCNGSQRIPTDGVTAILINKGASMTSDAVMLAVDRQIQIHFMDRKGIPIGLVWSYKYGSVSTIRKKQIDFCNSQQGYSSNHYRRSPSRARLGCVHASWPYTPTGTRTWWD